MELVGRAVEFLRERHAATPEELASHVFGGSGFVSLLESLEDDRLLFDGSVWRLRGPGDEVATLEILATGPNPRRHHIVEVAACRNGVRFHALIASYRKVPALLRRLGVPEQSDDWPALGVASDQLRSVVGHAAVAGFGFVPDYLDQLLGIGWPAIDLLRLVQGLGFRGRPDPASVARYFGLKPPRGLRPESMLDFSSSLWERVRAERPVEDLRALGEPARRDPPALPALAEEPGVYVMASAEGQALYVGKSVNLKRRVKSYLRSPIALSRNLHDLIERTDRIEVVPVDSELEALLLEQRLIDDYLPPFNVQRGRSERPRYLRLSTNESFPRITSAPRPKDDGAVYFGPFRHATAASRLRNVLGSVLGLRTCARRLPPRGKPRPACSKAAAGECLAPCVPGPPPRPYDAEVTLARRLLGASPDEFRRLLLRLLRERPPSLSHAPRIRRQLKALAKEGQPVLDLSVWE